MIKMNDDELVKAFAEAYWKAESAWQEWRCRHPGDGRNGLDFSGSPEEDQIAANWRAFKPLFDEWGARHPAPFGYSWGIKYPSHEPSLFRNMAVKLDNEVEHAY